MQYADVILGGGTVHTMDPHHPLSNAVAVTDGRISALDSRSVAALRGPETEVIDLAGRAVLPGFIDAHVHPLPAGLQMLTADLSGVHSLTDYRRIISDFARANPGNEWIEGAGWYGDVFPGGFPHRSLLDELVPDRPALLFSHDAHGAWVNSRALELAGIDTATADPDGGRIVRDGDGQPTGMLLERAMDLVDRLIPAPDDARIRRALLASQEFLHRHGITGWQDAAVGRALGSPDPYPYYRALDAEGLLTGRVTGALWWERERGLEQVAGFVARRAECTDRFRTTAVKIMQDGVCENMTAAMTRPYQGHPDERGLSLVPADELRDITRALDEKGFDLHLHAVGDQAVRDCLDALELPGRPGWDPRHQIAHLDLVDPEDFARFAELGVIANIQPLWARHDPVLVETKLPLLDSGHLEVHFAFRRLQDSGAPVAMGSDWPVSSPDPLWGIHTAVNRTAPAHDPHANDDRSRTDPLLPHEALTLEAALHAATAGAAHAARLDAHCGSIRIGLDADLVVLDADPYQVEASALGDLQVDLTFAGGRVVHRRPTGPASFGTDYAVEIPLHLF